MTCHACLNRFLAVTPAFWDMLKDRRVLLVTRTAAEVKPVLEAEPYRLHISHTLAFHQYEQMPETLQWITSHKDDFDIARFSCLKIDFKIFCHSFYNIIETRVKFWRL
ncbi:GT-D fold domain-containing glycosyltransferase [Paenibacillus peoriae]|uniref:GT-D fold domain-containing glycosyltransferase n=1 Tax=Paenibacillus peoriae TaxID=59893 RepID=UPI00240EF2F1|nr:GT-D fold domain-containing glycosyltransferase [Paenibacillus peoriae]MEC0182603.1 GT-D fold domain-containing glycosyltransferase [Paenibacillus peoriae]